MSMPDIDLAFKTKHLELQALGDAIQVVVKRLPVEGLMHSLNTTDYAAIKKYILGDDTDLLKNVSEEDLVEEIQRRMKK